MTDLNRLLTLHWMEDASTWNDDLQKEYQSLKAKIEGKIEKGDKFDVLNEVFEDYPKGWLDMKDDLESQVKTLHSLNQDLKYSQVDLINKVAKLKEVSKGHVFDRDYYINLHNEATREIAKLKEELELWQDEIINEKAYSYKLKSTLDEIKKWKKVRDNAGYYTQAEMWEDLESILAKREDNYNPDIQNHLPLNHEDKK